MFTGAPVIQQISDNIVRVTGVSLAPGASGTIGLAARTVPGEVALPASFKPEPYNRPGIPPNGGNVDLVEAIDVTCKPTTTGAIIVSVPVHVGKAGGTPETWLATLTNPTAGPGSASQTLEIYIKFNQ